MMRGLTWKRKNQLLLAGGVLLLWIVYSYAITNTLEARSSCQTLQLRIDSAATAPEQLAQLEQQLAGFSSLTMTTDSTAAIHEHLLGVVTNYCQQHNLVLRDFSSPVILQQQEWRIENHPITVEGTFVDLLQLVNHLEQEPKGHVISTEYRSRRDNKTQELSLSLLIYLQTIRNAMP